MYYLNTYVNFLLLTMFLGTAPRIAAYKIGTDQTIKGHSVTWFR